MMNEDKVSRGRHRSVSEWQTLIESQSRSGMGVKVFCAERGIGYSTFCKWKTKLRGASAVPSRSIVSDFVELSAEHGTGTGSWDVELELGDGMVLRVARR